MSTETIQAGTIADQPAFPTDVVSRDAGGTAMDLSPTAFSGMTMRQYYAGQALQGYLASMEPGPLRKEFLQGWAEDCVNMADALIAELSKSKP